MDEEVLLQPRRFLSNDLDAQHLSISPRPPPSISSNSVIKTHTQSNLRRRLFEKRLRAIRRVTPAAALFQTLNWFINACALAWGTAVPLASFAKELESVDFYAVLGLLLAEVIRFWMASTVLQRRYTMSPCLRRIISILQTLMAHALLHFVLPQNSGY